jgi:PAS domain S-box-containing protein/putative nucleotidyltransferase with HDIG domain
MAAGTAPPDAAGPSEPDELVRFAQFVNWILLATVAFGVLELALAVILNQPRVGVIGVLSLAYAGIALLARRWLARGRLRAAAVLCSAGMLAFTLAGALALPFIYPTVIVLTFVAVALALPHAHGREIAWLIVVAWVVGVGVDLAGTLLPGTLDLPEWLKVAFGATIMAIALGLAFLLLWQYTRRLNDTLDQARSANRELQDQVARRAQAEAELAGERNMLRTLMDNVPDFFYAKDTASRFTMANRASASSVGQTPETIVGKTDFELQPPDAAATFYADEQDVMRSGQPLYDREETLTTDGVQRWWLTTTVPLRGGDGRVTGMVGIAREITERKRAEAQLQQRLAELEALNRLSKAVRTAGSLDEMLDAWLAAGVEVARALGGVIWLHDPARDELRPARVRGWEAASGEPRAEPLLPGAGLARQVFASGQPAVSPDTASVTVPVHSGESVIGAFTLYLAPGRSSAASGAPATAGDVGLLTTLSEIAASAIQRMRSFDEVEQRLGQLSALRAIDRTITASLDLRVTLSVVLDQAVNQLRMAAADVLLFSPATQSLQFALGRGLRANGYRDLSVQMGEGRAGRVVLEREVVVTSDLRLAAPPSLRSQQLLAEGFISYVGAPLIAKGQVLGVLELFQRGPFQPDLAWLEFLSALASQAAIALDNARLFDTLAQRNREMLVAYDATIEGWSAALDLRDKETQGHSQRVTDLTLQLAQSLGFTDEQLVHVRRGALLHDIGKMGIADAVLLKPGPLSDEEWVVMRQHPAFAYEVLQPIQFLRPALDIPYCHHERWDGSGYPRGLAGEAIPLAARIFAVVDVWDALRSDRPYRLAWGTARVLDYLRAQSGKQFDPAVVEAFMTVISSVGT